MTDSTQREVVILGGGLAGLTLAMQLKQNQPDRDVLVIERRPHPVREAAHKVGESTVEVGAHYFAKVLGLEKHLLDDQLPKFGLRFFFRDQPDQDMAERLEVGGSQFFPTPSYQVDRGILENHLAEECMRLGVDFVDAAVAKKLDIGAEGALHRVEYEANGERHTVQARWLVDAAGRANLVKRKLDLAEPVAHNINAAWFRLGECIDLEKWSDRPEWFRFGENSNRWLSTNHLMGPGYWVWLIPLGSGSISVGIVADPRLHPAETFADFETALAWLEKNEPFCASAVAERRDSLQDFLRLKGYSHSCKQVFSADRWALTGEAGVFLDPFYSPGSDFIAYSNTFITEFIRRDFAGEELPGFLGLCEKMYFSFFRNSLRLFEDQYPLFGNGRIMPVKIIWDYVLYWCVLAFLFFGRQQLNFNVVSRVQHHLARAEELNDKIQKLFREWHEFETAPPNPGHLDHHSIAFLRELNRQLSDEFDTQGFLDQFERNMETLEIVAAEIAARACSRHSSIECDLSRTAANDPLLNDMFAVLDL